MELEESESLDEGVNHVGGNLLALVEHDVHTLEESNEVLVFDLSWQGRLEHSLDNCIQSSHEVLLINIEGCTCTDINDLEGTQKTSQDVGDAAIGFN